MTDGEVPERGPVDGGSPRRRPIAPRNVLLTLGIAAGLVLLFLVLAQIFLPPRTAGEVEDRLTEDGGEAEVEISAFPAAQLLFEEGDRVEVRGEGIELRLPDPDERAFEALDGFDEVDIELDDVGAGPIDFTRVELQRDGPDPYRLIMRGELSGSSVSAFVAEALGAGPLGQIVAGQIARGALAVPVPIDFDLELESDDGEVKVVGGNALVAGFDAAPIAEIVSESIAIRI